MVIEENIKTTTFEKLNTGDIFRYENSYFLKTPYSQTENYNFNCYDLKNDTFCYLFDYRTVTPVKAKLVIE